MSFCDGVLIVIGGMPVDVKGACDQLRAAAGGEHIEESHIQLCLPGKVCNIYFKGQRLTYIRSQAGSFLYKVVDVVVISKNPLTFSVWKLTFLVHCQMSAISLTVAAHHHVVQGLGAAPHPASRCCRVDHW